jgi:hypothetical protein
MTHDAKVTVQNYEATAREALGKCVPVDQMSDRGTKDVVLNSEKYNSLAGVEKSPSYPRASCSSIDTSILPASDNFIQGKYQHKLSLACIKLAIRSPTSTYI